jgi:hypothetical protein
MVRTGIPVSQLEAEGEEVILTLLDLLNPGSTGADDDDEED